MFPAIRCARRPPSSRRSIGTVTSGRAAVASPSSSASAASRHRPSAIVSPDPRFVQKNKNRDVGSRREPLGRRSAPAAGAGRSAHADARRAPRARVWAASMANAASSSASAASRHRPSAIVSPDPRFVQKNKNRDVGSRREPLGRRSAPAAGAGRSAHADARRAPRARVWAASMANAASSSASAASRHRPSAIVSPDPRFVQKNKNRDVGSRREPLGRRSAPAAGAGRSAHADARRAPRARVWAASMANAASSSASAASRHRPSAIVSPDPRFVQKNKNRDVGSRREPLGRRSAPAAGAGRSAHADARRAPRARVWAASMANAASSSASAASRHRPSAIVSPVSGDSYKRTKIATSAAGASRSVAAAHRRLGRVGLLTPMRAVPLARACGQRVWQTPFHLRAVANRAVAHRDPVARSVRADRPSSIIG